MRRQAATAVFRAASPRTLSAVTLAETGIALTENYLKVELGSSREAGAMVDVRIAGVTPTGLRESALPITLPLMIVA